MAEAPKQQIGSASMENDGTIVMPLRMTQGQAVGDLENRYVPGTPDYQADARASAGSDAGEIGSRLQ